MTIQTSVNSLALPHCEKMVFVLLGLFWLAIAGFALLDASGRGVALLVRGTTLGAVFLSFQYGFASGWRHFIVDGKTMALAPHFLLAALCALIVIPADLWGLTALGSLVPISFSLFVVAFALGIGMHLANVCCSALVAGPGQCSWRCLFSFWVR